MLIHTIKVEVKDEVIEKFTCSQCNFETEHEKFLKRHELSHKQNKHFKCKKCDFITLYKIMYLKHMQAHKSKKNKGRDKDSEKKILKEKSNLNSIKCNECSFETSSREQLDIHRKIKHTTNSDNINLHKCAYCKYQTNWEPCLKRHIEREHPNAKPHKIKKKEKAKEKVEVRFIWGISLKVAR